MKSDEKTQLKRIALLIACASVLQITESLIPHPMPGVRLGLANMVTLIALVNLGFRPALEIAVLRTLISSFILGSFMSPGFMLSFSGALISTVVMGIFCRLSLRGRGLRLSLIGISLLGSITHNLVQIGLVYLVLIKHAGIFMLLPWLGVSAVIMGWFTGLVALHVCRKLDALAEEGIEQVPAQSALQAKSVLGAKSALQPEEPYTGEAFKLRHFTPIDSPIRRLPPVVKIMLVLAVALLVVFLRNYTAYGVILALLTAAGLLSRVPLPRLFSGIKRIAPFLIFSFALPVLFTQDGTIIWQMGPARITAEGFRTGSLFAWQLVLLMLSASLLVRTTSPKELTAGLKTILSPLKLVGMSGDRIATIVSLSWSAIPDFWEKTGRFIKHLKLTENKKEALVPALSNLIVGLYRQTDEQADENTIKEEVA